MAVKLSVLKTKTIDAVVDLEDGDVINITYKHNFHNEDNKGKSQAEIIAENVIKWDVLEDDGETMVPVTLETVTGLGTRVQNYIFDKMIEDLLPNRLRATL